MFQSKYGFTRTWFKEPRTVQTSNSSIIQLNVTSVTLTQSITRRINRAFLITLTHDSYITSTLWIIGILLCSVIFCLLTCKETFNGYSNCWIRDNNMTLNVGSVVLVIAQPSHSSLAGHFGGDRKPVISYVSYVVVPLETSHAFIVLAEFPINTIHLLYTFRFVERIWMSKGSIHIE